MSTNPSTATAVAGWVASNLGWRVLPLHPRTKRPLAGCADCRDGGGHTAAQCPCLTTGTGALCHGVWAATCDPAVVARWAARWQPAVWAVHLGASGLLAVDLDAHGGTSPAQPLRGLAWPAGDALPVDGIDTYATLASLRGQSLDLDTLVTETPSGGLHLLYTAQPGRWKSSSGHARPGDDTVRGGLGWQVDIKAYAGYVVLPGSTTTAGTYRRASSTPVPAPLPDWLATELIRTGHDRHATTPALPAKPIALALPGDCPGTRYAAGALRSACAELAAMKPNTGRNRKLFRSTSRLAGMCAAGWIDQADVEAALTDAAQQAALPAGEIRYVIASGFRNPRAVPEHRSTT
ncbi:hypothetical protein D5S17_14450 [Pseudonocardiaceae bacterium YIM PH 21723]|nr:hypothetical protein D5S17_14450 [Pseudonocardiaceae bacterium YIM PH 21723]